MHAQLIVPDHKHPQNVGFSFYMQLFQENDLFYFHVCLLLSQLISLSSLLEACSARLRGHRQSHTKVGFTISFKHSCFRRTAFIYFHACVMPKLLVSLTSQLEVCRARIRNH